MKSKLIIRFTLVFLVLLSCTKQIDDSILDVDIEELLVEVDPILSTENTISSVDDVYLNGDVVESFDYEILESDQFIRIVLPSGSNVSSVSIDFTMAENASLASSISGLNFTGTGIKLISVVAENGDTRTYALKIIVTGGVDPMPSPSEIISVTSVTASGIVVIPVEPAMFSDNSINVLLPAGTPLTDISFEFEITENSFLLDDATNLSFESGATNEVRLESEEGEVRIYTITVELENTPDLSDENDITKITATIGDAPNITIIDEREAPEFDASNSIILEVPFKTAISDVDLEFELSEFATLQIDDITTGLDFTGGVVKMFTVIAQDGSEQTYGIGVVIADPTEREALIEMYNPENVDEEFRWDLSEDSDIGLWKGIKINEAGKVIGIETIDTDIINSMTLSNYLQYLPELESIISNDTGLRLPSDEEMGGVILPKLKIIDFRNEGGNSNQFYDWLTNQTSLNSIIFSDAGPTILPQNLGNLINLEDLRVDIGNTIDIPDSISQLNALISLSLINDKFSTVPASLAELPNLMTLSIGNNPDLTSIPQAICDWGEIDGHTLSKDDTTICGDLSSENQIIDVQLFTEEGIEIPQTANINIDNLSNEVTIAVPTNTDITALRVNLDISDGASVIFDPTDAFDFTTPESFTVTAQDGVNAVWMVNVILDAAITPGEAFITTWTGTEVTIPINTAFTYNYNVDWDNDGTLDEFGITGEITHSFTTTGPHTIQITGEFPAINFFSASDSVIGLEQWGIEEWLGVVNAFRTCENIVFNATDVPDMTRVTDMSGMFLATGLANPDVTEWDVSSVTTMEGMFSLAVSADPDVSAWDVSSVVNMRNMFNGATSADPDISTWDVTNVVTTTNMFINSGITNPDLSNWNIENVNTMDRMFDGVTLSTEVYDQLLIDLSTKTRNNNVSFHGGNSTYCSAEAAAARQALEDTGWIITDGGQATGCESEVTITPGEAFITTWTGTEVTIPINTAFTYNYNVDWDNDGILDEFGITSEITHSFTTTGPHTIQITGEFPAINFSSVSDSVIGLEQWGTQEWLSVSSAFSGCENLIINATDVPDFTSVTSMGSMFRNAILANPDVSLWNTTNVTIMTSMFFGASSANPDVSLWNTTNVTIMGSMFRDATLANPDVSLWDTSNVTNMFNMFSGAEIANPDVSLWDTTNVTNMESMFSNSGIMDPDFSNWDLGNIFTMGSIFSEVTLSTEVYDQLLIDLSSKGQSRGIPFDGGNSTYCSSEAASARELLVNSGWTITDLGPMADCQTTFSPEIQAQRDALLSMFDATSGANWSEDTDLSTWHGITVNEQTGNVISIVQNQASSFQPITTFNENLGALLYLETLDSSNTGITSLPESIGNLTALTSLVLNDNSLTSLPESIGNLTSLSFLIANDNSLTSLPESLGDLRELTVLLLQNNSLVSLPESIGDLAALTVLDLTFNSLTSLPESIGNLTSLPTLDLDNNSLVSLPESIGNLTALSVLDLKNNSLTSLPESIAGLTSLAVLDLENNSELLSISKGICDLETFGTLSIRKDATTICGLYTPEIQAQRDALLSMYNDNIESRWSEDTDMSQWGGVSLDTNGNVIGLSFDNEDGTGIDPITNINSSLGDLIYLESISTRETGPSTFTTDVILTNPLENLRSLSFEKEPIQSIPDWWINSLPNLESITFIDDISNDMVLERIANIQSLTSIRLSDTAFTQIPSSIAELENLTIFQISNNTVQVLIPSAICERNDNDPDFTLNTTASAVCSQFPPEIQAQRDALLSMYTPNGRLDWAEDTDMGDWSGISADINGNVTRLILIDEYDGVTLNNNLSDLTYLTELTYSENSNTLTSIPDVFEGLTALRILNLEQNNITSLPASIASLINLELIDLTETDVTSLPDSLCERVLNGDLIIEKDDGRTEVNCQ